MFSILEKFIVLLELYYLTIKHVAIKLKFNNIGTVTYYYT